MNEWVKKIIDYLSIQLLRSCRKQSFCSYTSPTYLGFTSKLSDGKELVKFTLGNHKLRSELAEMIKFEGLSVLFGNLIKLKMNLKSHFLMHCFLEMNEKRWKLKKSFYLSNNYLRH